MAVCCVYRRAFVWAVFCVAVKSRIEKVARFLLNCVESLLNSVIFWIAMIEAIAESCDDEIKATLCPFYRHCEA